MRWQWKRLWGLCLLAGAALAHAQGGPPYLTNDPGTPGAGNWEINVASMATHAAGATAWQLPQLDVNFGVGDRIQLTYQQSYVLQSASGAAEVTGWSNAFLGVKWRFLDQGEGGWQVSTFPQFETAGSALAQAKGIAIAGPRWLLPLEVSHRVGPVDVNVEAGYFFSSSGPHERFLGLVVGRQVNARLELDAEVYADRATAAPPDDTTLDLGLRYRMHPAFILLAMAGRSISGSGTGHTQFMGYLGVQVLLSDYGRALARDPGG
ncbi:MAG: hypothetical protein JSS29_15360 [Proteobacteria bacterium]|nr:hypothetical protein [Pseudomonadota bacterium]